MIRNDPGVRLLEGSILRCFWLEGRPQLTTFRRGWKLDHVLPELTPLSQPTTFKSNQGIFDRAGIIFA